MKTLLETITEKATVSFGKEVTKENWKQLFGEWCVHWIATAEQWANELEAEGLQQTAARVREHAEWNRKNVLTIARKAEV